MPAGATTPPTSAAQLVPALQSLVGALEGLVAALQGASTAGGGGTTGPAATTGAMGAPEAAQAQAAAGAAHAGHAPGREAAGGGNAGHASHGASGGGGHSHHGMKIIKRTQPADPARAQQNLNAVYQTFGRHTRAGLDFRHNQTHGYLGQGERAAFRRQFPGLPVPQSLVFREGSNTPIGAVYRNNEGPFDLGMGDRHVHDDNPKSQMQHIWFTPNHVEFAFSDVAHGMTGGTSKAMRRLGYPT